MKNNKTRDIVKFGSFDEVRVFTIRMLVRRLFRSRTSESINDTFRSAKNLHLVARLLT